MSAFRSILRLDAVPSSTDLGLLVLRLWVGLSMAGLHGAAKFQQILAGSAEFGDPIGLGPRLSLLLAGSAEFLASLLLVIGLATRWAAGALAFTMGVAFLVAHGAKLTGEGNGEKAFVFLGCYVVLLLTGAGRFSLDARLKA